ncbi:MAG: hypothetical protein WD810_09075 [Solirubrobacterales bacterium]
MIGVAGSTGHIGGLLCARLREDGEDVRALARNTERAGHATAETLRAGEVPVAYFRAAAVIGAGGESFRPLIEGLSTETVVTDPTGVALFPGIRPAPLTDALRDAAANVTVRL